MQWSSQTNSVRGALSIHQSPRGGAQKVLDQLRLASVATAGGFRPPENQTTSWFSRGVGYLGGGLPEWKGEAMFPVLQARIDNPSHLREAITRVG